VSAQSLREKRAAYTEDLGKALERIVTELSANPEVECVILFGSYADGRRDLLTDLDVLVIMESRLDYVTRTAELYRQLHPGVDLDLLVYTPQEFERMRTRGFLRHVLEHSKVLYEKG
jgi:predicted nucleotidyltransferase